MLTDATLTHALTPMVSTRFTSVPVGRLPVLHVDERTRYQRMIGFGAAMTDSSAWLLHTQLGVRSAAGTMRALFAPSGLHLTLVRIPMGASDFTVGGVPYTYDDVPPGQSDPSLSRFSVAHDLAYIIPALRAALANNPSIDVLATPWTAPPWMKVNDAADDLGGRGVLLSADYGPFAQYFVKFIEAYHAHGIPIWGLTAANEPNAKSAFPAMFFTAADEARFITQNLAPSLRADGLHARIWGLDSGAILPYAQALVRSPAAADLAGLAWHCYGGQQAMGALHKLAPATTQILSECSPGIIPYGAAELALSAVRNWASAVSLWNLALDPAGGPVQPPNTGCRHCTGLITVSERTRRPAYTLNYYQLGQLSRYVQPGAVRIGSDRWVTEFRNAPHYGVTPGVDNAAFRNPDGSLVLVCFNNQPLAARFAVAWYGRTFTATLAPRATVTYRWR